MTWHKRVLRVDLTTHETFIEPLNEEWANDYLGSRGLASKYLMEMMDPCLLYTSPSPRD